MAERQAEAIVDFLHVAIPDPLDAIATKADVASLKTWIVA